MKHFLKLGALIVVLIHLLFAPNKGWAEPIPIFVSILPQKYFVERIGKEHVKVEVMVNPGESPATFSPNPKKMSLLSQASLYFSIGVPFENIWAKRIQSIHTNLQWVPLHDATQIVTHHEHEPHSHDSGDPHIWTSPARVKRMAKIIKDALTHVQPNHEKFFAANLQSFKDDLDALDRDIRQTLAKTNDHRFMVFHPAWTHFAEDYGLEQISIEEGGKEPGARALQKIIAKGKKLEIKVIFVQKQFSLSIARKIANMMGARVREIDPLAEDYMENMRRTANAISGELQ
ncbi:MAG: zinc ABC transporter solute-binding protein [Nitrospinaceae bacterium]|jgi:zinc transport system substrate-binding protein|nr:zinc ABC transporter solute-binding protein [Nitrospina sp.]MBT5867606.1 zinc ABC transporter solute-binding protein [Nitrospinaceae bacterium]MBT6345516.1 zinc ABC transporter solute-binding protein [Nitrospina sp.]